MSDVAPGRTGSPLNNRSLGGLVVTQFLGAFNDNLFKQLVLLLGTRGILTTAGGDAQADAFIAFALPFVIFSGIAGNVSERFSKRDVIVAMKIGEVVVMSLAVVALWLGDWTVVLTTLFIMGTQSAFFGPSKYGIVPELVDRRQLLSANSVIVMTTFLAILLGQALAGPLIDHLLDLLWVIVLICVAIAVVGTCTALTIERTPALRPDSRVGWNPFGGLWSTIRELRKTTPIVPIVVLNSLFWFNGGVIQQAVNGMWVPEVLNLGARENTSISYLLVALALSLIGGSLAAPKVAQWISPARMPLAGASMMGGAQCLLLLVGAVVPPDAGGFALAVGALCIVGVGGALFAVPLVSFIQDAPPESMKGKAFAVNNFMNFLLIFFAGAFYKLATALEILPTVTAATSGLGLVLAVVLCRRGFARLTTRAS